VLFRKRHVGAKATLYDQLQYEHELQQRSQQTIVLEEEAEAPAESDVIAGDVTGESSTSVAAFCKLSRLKLINKKMHLH